MPFPDSMDSIECLSFEYQGEPGNMFSGNYDIARHIVDVHRETKTCPHCKCSLPAEDGVQLSCPVSCPGYPRCPFEVNQCPSEDTPSTLTLD